MTIFDRLISLHSKIFSFVGNFKKAAINENCQAVDIINTEDLCKNAANEIGLTYKSAINTDKYPIGCFHKGYRLAWFNKKLNGPTKEWKAYWSYGGVCHLQGKL